MSVYIKGFPLPNNCGACPLRLAWCRWRIYMVTRPERCPLVHIPEHGRLIDADAELERLKHCMFPSDMVTTTAVGMYEEWLKNAPTIIPASTADKEGE